MRLKRFSFSILHQLLLTRIGIFIILTGISVVTVFFIRSWQKEQWLVNAVKEISYQQMYLQYLKEIFISKEVINPDFFRTGNSKVLREFEISSMQIESNINQIIHEQALKDELLSERILQIRDTLKKYTEDFNELVGLVKERGFKDYGIEGKMREEIHLIEQTRQLNNDPHLKAMMLMLRRNEKDYIIRKDLRYRDEHGKNLAAMYDYLRSCHSMDEINKQLMVQRLDAYRRYFTHIIDLETEIGLTDNGGKLGQLHRASGFIHQSVNEMQNILTERSNHSIQRAVARLLLTITVLSLIILLVLYRVSHYIVKSLKSLHFFIMRLGRGELPEEITSGRNDEIGEMISAINVLVKNLHRTKQFAIEVGNGNFETDINVFDNKGELGGNLMEMRKKLLEVAHERKEQEKEAQRRLWMNEGTTQVNEIFRKYNSDLKEMCFQVTRYIVKYCSANQAGLFLLNDESDEVCFELTAAYAYDKRKHVNYTVRLNEGLVGACAMEKQSIYLTDIPNDYLNITSGMGGSNPRSLLIVPLIMDETVVGIFEIASFTLFEKHHIEFIEKIAYTIAASVASSKINNKTRILLERSQMQAEELISREEELRQNMEELQAAHDEFERREQELLKQIESVTRECDALSAKLRKDNRRLSQLFDTLGETVLVGEVDLEGRFIYTNERLNVFLYSSGIKIENQTVFEVFVKPDGTNFRKSWKKIISGKIHHEFLHNKNNGTHQILKLSFIPYYENGKISKIILAGKIIMDITHPDTLVPEYNKTMKELAEELHRNIVMIDDLQRRYTSVLSEEDI